MGITYSNIFHSKALQNFFKLGFLVWKYNIWLPLPRPYKNHTYMYMYIQNHIHWKLRISFSAVFSKRRHFCFVLLKPLKPMPSSLKRQRRLRDECNPSISRLTWKENFLIKMDNFAWQDQRKSKSYKTR
jgi:hypothetical protein